MPAIRGVQRIFVAIGEVDDSRAKGRPVLADGNPPCEPQFLAVLKILDRGNVTVKSEISNLGIGPRTPDRSVEFVAAERQAVLVDPEAVRELHEIAETHFGTADDV